MSTIDVKTLENYLNHTLGFWWWKKYVTTAFWSNISTPINLSITLLTAINTGQATTNNYISNNAFMYINITTLVLTSMNTFFRPFEQYKQSMEFLKKWYELGNDFENIYLTIDEDEKFEKYKELKERANVLIEQQEDSRNFIADLIHLFVDNLCLKNEHNWLDMYKKHLQNSNNSEQTDENNV